MARRLLSNGRPPHYRVSRRLRDREIEFSGKMPMRRAAISLVFLFPMYVVLDQVEEQGTALHVLCPFAFAN